MKKEVRIGSENNWSEQWYVLDVNGKPVAVYEHRYTNPSANNYNEYFDLKEHHLYGIERLGTRIYGDDYHLWGERFVSTGFTLGGAFSPETGRAGIVVPESGYGMNKRMPGTKRYELSNQTHNVQAVVTDYKVPYASCSTGVHDVVYYEADVVSYSDYYAFGAQMPGRSANSGDYRYGFNGQEKVDEISGSGNSYTAEFWQYDPRLGRRWNIDPMCKAWESSYAAFSNNPIYFIDPSGATPTHHEGSEAPANPQEGDTWNKGSGSNLQYNAGEWTAETVDIVTKSNLSASQQKANKAIYDFANNPNSQSYFPNIPKAQIVSDLRARVKSGGNEIMQSTNTCGIAAVCKLFAEADPEGYVQFTLDLYQYGTATYNNYSASVSSLFSQTAKQGDFGSSGGADLVLIGSIKDNEKGGIMPFNNSGWDGWTTTGKIQTLATDLLGLKEVDGWNKFKVSKANEMIKNGQKIYAMYLYPVGGFMQYHYRVYEGPVPGSNNLNYYWDYGSGGKIQKTSDFTSGFGGAFLLFTK